VFIWRMCDMPGEGLLPHIMSTCSAYGACHVHKNRCLLCVSRQNRCYAGGMDSSMMLVRLHEPSWLCAAAKFGDASVL
jgi:hypothetical protein